MTTSGNKGTSDAGNEFAAFVCDANVTESLVPVLAERGWALDCVNTGGIEMAIRVLGASPSPSILLVDLSESSDPQGDIDALAEVCEPGTSVIACGTVNDVGFYRTLIDAGLLDYFVKPFTPDDVRLAIHNAEQAIRMPDEVATPADEDQHRAIAVIGVRGGMGASLFASTSAWIMANQLGHTVALLDLDIHFGTDALVFDLEPGRGLVDALDNPSRVDSLFIERAVIKESDNLSVLSAEASLNEAATPDPAALSHLVGELKNNYKILMMDTPRYLAAQYPFLLGEMTDVVLITDMTLAATRDTIRLISFVKEVAPQAHIRIAANRIGASGLVEVDQKDFEASIERKIDWIIPNDPKNIVMAAKRAKPLPQVAPSSKLVQAVKNICQGLVGKRDDATQESFWKRIMVSGKKK